MEARSYPGWAFHPEFGAKKVSGALRFAAGSAEFEADGRRASLPLEGLKVERGGASSRLLFFSHAAAPGVSFFTSEEAALSDPAFSASPALAAQAASAVTAGRLSRLGTWGAAAGLVVLIVLAFQLKEPLVGALAGRVPASWEAKIGEAAFAQVKLGRSVVETPEAVEGLRKLAAPLLKGVETRHELRFHVVRDASVNAFAFPGGHVVAHTGLLLAADSPEEAAGVLAHEIAHVARRHSLRHMIESAGFFLVVQAFLGDMSGLLGALTSQGAQLVDQKFSRDYEREADAEGLRYLDAAGIDPAGMLRFFERLKAEKDNPLGRLSENLSFLSTHPATAERIERLRRELAKLETKSAYASFDMDWRGFQQALKK